MDSHVTRFVVDCGVVLHLASEGIELPAEHDLLAPTLLRSQTLSALHEAVHGGEIPPNVALDRLTRIRAMPIRLLGDAVLRRRAWDLAEQLGWVVLGAEQEVVVLELADGLSVTLPMQLARELLRPLVSEAGLHRVQETLREDGAPSGDVWVKRLKQLQTRLRGGDPLELAEIVRDGARRERTLTASGTTSKLSFSEKGLCVKARQRLSGEIGLARGLDRAEVDAWIDEQLAPIGS